LTPPLVELPGFDERVRRHTYTGNRLPVLYAGRRHCRRCTHGELLAIEPIIEDALFAHGGYGASTRKTVEVCLACGAVNVTSTETLRPPRNLRP
jgi:hypothetical protein